MRISGGRTWCIREKHKRKRCLGGTLENRLEKEGVIWALREGGVSVGRGGRSWAAGKRLLGLRGPHVILEALGWGRGGKKNSHSCFSKGRKKTNKTSPTGTRTGEVAKGTPNSAPPKEKS